MLVLLACLMLSAGVARADGDPASDVLATQALFLPADAQIAPATQARIEGLVRAVNRAGHPLRVAVIEGPMDLGSVGALWPHPRAYAGFLAVELSLIYHGTLLVVMPNGVATETVATRPTAGAFRPTEQQPIGQAAVTALSRVASDAGLALPGGPAAHSAMITSGRSEPVAWLAFAAGCVLVMTCWAASIRARPLRAGA